MPPEDPIKQCGTLINKIRIAEDDDEEREVLIRNSETGEINILLAASMLKLCVDYLLKEFKLTGPPQNYPDKTNYAINEFAVVYQLSRREISRVIQKFALDNGVSNLEISLCAVKY